MNKQEQINMLQFRIERIESHLAEQHKGNNFNLSEKPNSCDHLLPAGYEFCTEGEMKAMLKVELAGLWGEYPIGTIAKYPKNIKPIYKKSYRPIRPIQYHVAVHEAVTAEHNPYAVDWSNAPKEADTHAFDKSGKGWFYGLSFNDMFWYAGVFDVSGFTLPTGLDWKKSKTTRPCK